MKIPLATNCGETFFSSPSHLHDSVAIEPRKVQRLISHFRGLASFRARVAKARSPRVRYRAIRDVLRDCGDPSQIQFSKQFVGKFTSVRTTGLLPVCVCVDESRLHGMGSYEKKRERENVQSSLNVNIIGHARDEVNSSTRGTVIAISDVRERCIGLSRNVTSPAD